MEVVIPERVADRLATFSSFLLSFRAVPTFDFELSCHLVMSSQYVVDLLQLLQWKQLFDTAGEKKCWQECWSQTRKAAYRCNKGRLENKFSYLVLNFAALMVLRSYRITTMLSRDPICLLAVFTQNCMFSSYNSEKEQLRSEVPCKRRPIICKMKTDKTGSWRIPANPPSSVSVNHPVFTLILKMIWVAPVPLFSQRVIRD